MSGIRKLFLSFFGCGYLPLAPGTVGSIAGFVVLISLPEVFSTKPDLQLSILFFLIFFLTFGAIPIIEAESPRKNPDQKWIVIDEVVGVAIAIIPYFVIAGFGLLHALVALLFFRFFDIVKPLGIKDIDAQNTPASVMLDDIVAGIYALFCGLLTFIIFDQFHL